MVVPWPRRGMRSTPRRGQPTQPLRLIQPRRSIPLQRLIPPLRSTLLSVHLVALILQPRLIPLLILAAALAIPQQRRSTHRSTPAAALAIPQQRRSTHRSTPAAALAQLRLRHSIRRSAHRSTRRKLRLRLTTRRALRLRLTVRQSLQRQRSVHPSLQRQRSVHPSLQLRPTTLLVLRRSTLLARIHRITIEVVFLRPIPELPMTVIILLAAKVTTVPERTIIIGPVPIKARHRTALIS